MKSINQMLSVKPTGKTCSIHSNEPIFLVFDRETCKLCAAELIEKSKNQSFSDQNKALHDQRVMIANIPDRHAKCSLDNYEVKHLVQRNAKSQVVSYVHQLLDGGNGNLLMYGKTGTGKTHLACAVISTLLKKKKMVKYIRSEDIVQIFFDSWDRRDISEKQVIQQFLDPEILVIDEYSLHDTSEKKSEILHKIISARYDKKKSIILISNESLEKIQQQLGDRNWSRMHHDGLFLINFTWDDERFKK